MPIQLLYNWVAYINWFLYKALKWASGIYSHIHACTHVCLMHAYVYNICVYMGFYILWNILYNTYIVYYILCHVYIWK